MKNYPKFDGKSYKYVKHPVMQDGKWFGADVVENGYYISPLAIPFEKESDCQRACDSHNSFEGWNKGEAREIIRWSMGLDK